MSGRPFRRGRAGPEARNIDSMLCTVKHKLSKSPGHRLPCRPCDRVRFSVPGLPTLSGGAIFAALTALLLVIVTLCPISVSAGGQGEKSPNSLESSASPDTGQLSASPAGIENFPPLADDMPLAGLIQAAETSRAIMEPLDDTSRFLLCGREYTPSRLRLGLNKLISAARRSSSSNDLTSLILEDFHLCPFPGPITSLGYKPASTQPSGSGSEKSAPSSHSGNIFLTGYFEPLVRGRLEPDESYRYPLYRPPSDLVRRQGRTGRMVDGRLLPYWSRAEIEEGVLPAGNELVYLADPFEVFTIHVQGSARIELPDGAIRPIQYAARNGHPYKSIGRLLVKEGRLSLEEADMPGIRRYLRNHPEQLERVLRHNFSYIFFRWGKGGKNGPDGSFGFPLTAGRSLALDQNHYPPGATGYLLGVKPTIDEKGEIVAWQPFGRVVFNQDSGSAIKGLKRADIFWGSDRHAEIAAGATRHPATLYLLLPR